MQAEEITRFTFFSKWKVFLHSARTEEQEQVLTYKALTFRISKLCSKAFKIWRTKTHLQSIIQKAERKLVSATLGFPFYCLKNQSDTHYVNYETTHSQNSSIMLHNYEISKLKHRLANNFRKQSLFKSWKEISLSKRLDFPLSYHNLQISKKAFHSFKICLKQSWINQKNSIICEAYLEKQEEKYKMKVFIKLFQNVLRQKKKRFQKKVADDYRKEVLVVKGWKAIKEHKQRGEMSMMRTSMIKSQSSDSRELKIDDLKEFGKGDKDELLDDIYQRVMTFKRKMLKTRCFVAWKYHLRYEKSMSIKSSPMTEKDDQLELTNSSILNLSLSNENQTPGDDDLDMSDEPKSFREEYGEEQPSKSPHDYTESHCQRFFQDLEDVMKRRKVF